MYKLFVKRLFDIVLSFAALVVLSPLLLILSLLGLIYMQGNPFFFQPRPTKDERIFHLVKFRTMSNAKDKEGNLLPDDVRLNGYGKFLRSTSLDELPELWNILVGDMSIIGPRPQLVRDMVFMTSKERKRHTVRAGLTGLAQVNGRNNISWEDKFKWDLKYIEDITFMNDVKIIFATVGKVLKRSDVVREGTVSDLDLGDYLLQAGKITQQQYDLGQKMAKELLKGK